MTIAWRRLTSGDLPMLARWLAEPRVARWWCHDSTAEGVERDFGPSCRGEEPGEDLVVSVDGEPVGLVQRSLVAAYPEDVVAFSSLIDLPVGAVELDYLIGDERHRGQGLGPRMIAAVLAETWDVYPDCPAALVSVVAANRASWRALEKAGLRRVAEGDLEPDNPIDPPLHYVYRADRPGEASGPR